MKILHLIGGKEIAGSKNHLISLLDQSHRDEIYLGVFEKGEIYDEAVKCGIKVYEFNQKSRYDLSIVTKIKRLIKNETIDIVHTHGPRANLYGYIVSKIASFVWVTTVHSDPRVDFMGRGLLGWGFTKINLHVLKKVNHYFAISKRFKDILVHIGVIEEKITTVYNGIMFDELPASQLTRQDLGLDDGDFVMTTIGRLHPIKGHKYLIASLDRLIKAGLNVKLLIVGDGPMKKELVKYVDMLKLTDCVTFLGHQDDVYSYYALSDVKVLSSLSESFPLVILEAARARIPVISTDVGGVRELISKPERGWVVPPKNEGALAEVIEEAITHKHDGTLKTYGQNLYEFASENYSIDQLVRDIELTYDGLMDHGRKQTGLSEKKGMNSL